MSKASFYPTILFFVLSLSSAAPSQARELEMSDARLKLAAVPKMGNFPLTVQIQATIQDADERDRELYCLDADWDFDHVRFLERKDCPPFEDGTVIQRSYTTSHTFELPGTYRVRLTLRRGRDAVIQGDVWIRVLMVRNEDAAGSTSVDIMNTPIRAEVSDLLRSPVEYAYRTVIVKGRLEVIGNSEYALRDRRSLDKTIRVVFLDFTSPVGDEVEVMGRFRSATDANMTSYEQTSMRDTPKDIFIEAQTIDSLEYDVQPADLEPSGELTTPGAKKRKAPSGPPPEVVFALPMDQERGVDLDTEFQIQFSEDMDPECFGGNVSIQYVDEAVPAPEVSLEYDERSRSLVVRPETLAPGQEVQLILYDGIVGKDGLPLKPAVLLSRRASLDTRSGRRKVLTLTYFTQ